MKSVEYRNPCNPYGEDQEWEENLWGIFFFYLWATSFLKHWSRCKIHVELDLVFFSPAHMRTVSLPFTISLQSLINLSEMTSELPAHLQTGLLWSSESPGLINREHPWEKQSVTPPRRPVGHSALVSLAPRWQPQRLSKRTSPFRIKCPPGVNSEATEQKASPPEVTQHTPPGWED